MKAFVCCNSNEDDSNEIWREKSVPSLKFPAVQMKWEEVEIIYVSVCKWTELYKFFWIVVYSPRWNANILLFLLHIFAENVIFGLVGLRYWLIVHAIWSFDHEWSGSTIKKKTFFLRKPNYWTQLLLDAAGGQYYKW